MRGEGFPRVGGGVVSALVTVGAVKMSVSAAKCAEEVGADVDADVAAIRSGATTREALLAHCLDGAVDDRVDGWREYVSAVCAAAEQS